MLLFVTAWDDEKVCPVFFFSYICPVVMLSFRIRKHLMRLMRQNRKLNVSCVFFFSPADWICLSEHKQIITFFLNLSRNLGFKLTPSLRFVWFFFSFLLVSMTCCVRNGSWVSLSAPAGLWRPSFSWRLPIGQPVCSRWQKKKKKTVSRTGGRDFSSHVLMEKQHVSWLSWTWQVIQMACDLYARMEPLRGSPCCSQPGSAGCIFLCSATTLPVPAHLTIRTRGTETAHLSNKSFFFFFYMKGFCCCM